MGSAGLNIAESDGEQTGIISSFTVTTLPGWEVDGGEQLVWPLHIDGTVVNVGVWQAES